MYKSYTLISDYDDSYRTKPNKQVNCLGSSNFDTQQKQVMGPTMAINYDNECEDSEDGYKKFKCLERSGVAAIDYTMGLMVTGRGGSRVPDFSVSNFGNDTSEQVAIGSSGPIGDMYLEKTHRTCSSLMESSGNIGYPTFIKSDKPYNPLVDKVPLYRYTNSVPQGWGFDDNVKANTRGLLTGFLESAKDLGEDLFSVGDLMKNDVNTCVPVNVWTLDMAPLLDASRVNPDKLGNMHRCCTKVYVSEKDAKKLREDGMLNCPGLPKEMLKNVSYVTPQYIGNSTKLKRPESGKCLCQQISTKFEKDYLARK